MHLKNVSANNKLYLNKNTHDFTRFNMVGLKKIKKKKTQPRRDNKGHSFYPMYKFIMKFISHLAFFSAADNYHTPKQRVNE